MPRYLVTYHGPGMPHDPESIAAAQQAFLTWAGKTGALLVEPGSPIAGTLTLTPNGLVEDPARVPSLAGRSSRRTARRASPASSRTIRS